MASRPYLGVATKHPHEINQFGRIELVSDNDLIKQSLLILFNTPLGSEFGREHFGNNIRQVMFEPNDIVARTLLDLYITDAVAEWEKRVRMVDIVYDFPVTQPGVINCTIVYLIKQASEIDSFIYPFYRQLNN